MPIIKGVHLSVFTAASKNGALDMGRWHTCNTTHCRAGWVVHLAGEEGRELEEKTSTCFAAMQIYKKSSEIAVPVTRFFDSSKDAMKDMERCAKEEKNLITNN